MLYVYCTQDFVFRIADKTLQLIQVTNEREKKPTIMLNLTDFKLRLFHWFAIGSKTVAHWTLYCSAPECTYTPRGLIWTSNLLFLVGITRSIRSTFTSPHSNPFIKNRSLYYPPRHNILSRSFERMEKHNNNM